VGASRARRGWVPGGWAGRAGERLDVFYGSTRFLIFSGGDGTRPPELRAREEEWSPALGLGRDGWEGGDGGEVVAALLSLSLLLRASALVGTRRDVRPAGTRSRRALEQRTTLLLLGY
jgi:hypothetical protein